MEKDAHSKSAPPSSLNDPTVSLSAPKGSEQKTALERIGTPDHVGWMRKKGEKYPTWKMRYFILKNANLYYLKSENVSWPSSLLSCVARTDGYLCLLGGSYQGID